MRLNKEQKIGQEIGQGILLHVQGVDSSYGQAPDATGARSQTDDPSPSRSITRNTYRSADPECQLALEHMGGDRWGEAEDVLQKAVRRETSPSPASSGSESMPKTNKARSSLAHPLERRLDRNDGNPVSENEEETGDADQSSPTQLSRDTLATLKHLATQLQRDGRIEDTELIRQQMLEIKDRCGSEVQLDTVRSLCNLLETLVVDNQRDDQKNQIGRAEKDLGRQFEQSDESLLGEETCCS